MQFPAMKSHSVILEPEGVDSDLYYVNGTATSLPRDVQERMLKSMKGLENCKICRYGYAIEYDYIPPYQINETMESKRVEGLYFAGQINGTSGYEEAAAQGLMAGINAAQSVKNQECIVCGRSEAYIGVLIDDIITKSVNEPYRIFTSRAEYRLLLRQDNADRRLMPIGRKLGLISAEVYKRRESIWREAEKEIAELKAAKYKGKTLAKLLKRPEETYASTCLKAGRKTTPLADAAREAELTIKYEGYLKRQSLEIEKFVKMEKKKIPGIFNYSAVVGLKTEARQKLERVRPSSIGQASRIEGVTPSDTMLLLVALKACR